MSPFLEVSETVAVAPRRVGHLDDEVIEHVLGTEPVELHCLNLLELQRDYCVVDEVEPAVGQTAIDSEDVDVELQPDDAVGPLPRVQPETSAAWSDGHLPKRSSVTGG